MMYMIIIKVNPESVFTSSRHCCINYMFVKQHKTNHALSYTKRLISYF